MNKSQLRGRQQRLIFCVRLRLQFNHRTRLIKVGEDGGELGVVAVGHFLFEVFNEFSDEGRLDLGLDEGRYEIVMAKEVQILVQKVHREVESLGVARLAQFTKTQTLLQLLLYSFRLFLQK